MDSVAETASVLQTMWLLITGIGILMMNVGFALLEAGRINPKHVKGTLLKNFSDNSIGIVVWVCFGYGLYNGSSEFAGGSESTFLTTHQPQDLAKLFHMFGFACASTTIVSGAIIGRIKFSVYLVFSAFLTGLCFPIQAHWTWNPHGWLGKMGFLDFAGGMIVHGFGGFAALTAAKLCGPRAGRFYTDVNETSSKQSSMQGSSSLSQAKAWLVAQSLQCSKRYCQCCVPFMEVISGDSDSYRRVRNLPEYSEPLSAVGAWFLFISWFSFNAGSASMISVNQSNVAALAAVNTLVAAGSGTVFGIVFCYTLKTRLDLNTIINSMLTSLVVMTSMCGYVDIWVGLLAGPLSVLTFTLFRFLALHIFGIDDPLDVFAVHAGGGLTGTLLLGCLHPTLGFFYSGEATFLGVQILGCVVSCSFGVVVALVYFAFAKLVVPNGFTYTREEQLAGLDYLFFEVESQKDLDYIAVQEYNIRQNLEKKAAAKLGHVNNGVKVLSPQGVTSEVTVAPNETWD